MNKMRSGDGSYYYYSYYGAENLNGSGKAAESNEPAAPLAAS
jgi:hypothetical protein